MEVVRKHWKTLGEIISVTLISRQKCDMLAAMVKSQKPPGEQAQEQQSHRAMPVSKSGSF